MPLEFYPLRMVLAVGVLSAAPFAVRANDFFEKSVRPVLSANCFRCHGAKKHRGGLRLDSRQAVVRGGDSGPAAFVGKPDDSLLIQAVRHQKLKMPPRHKLSDEQIAVLAKWIAEGAVWGEQATVAKAGEQTTRVPGRITDTDRAWWAFQTPTRPAVPSSGVGWGKTPIDCFIAQRLQSEYLVHAPPADRKTLIRRLTFDLTGLPPTPAEIATFEADSSANAYEKLVDRLLSSPRYGERQARAWLDLVRYAESDGYRADAPRPYAWKYRDYVVRSFNADKGYDRFVREQLAGDELYPGDSEALLATGYLRMWPYEYNQLNVRGQWSAILNDITDVTADTFFALGMSCARCHDHKFDPILQRDYFSLQAFFAGIRFVDEPVFSSEAIKSEYDHRRAAWEAKTVETRAKLDALVAPIHAKQKNHIENMFPPDIQIILRKPATERSPSEQQLYELAYRQVEFRSRGPTKGKQKAEYDHLKKELSATHEPPAPLAMVVRDIGPQAGEVMIPGGRKKAVPVEPTFPVVLSDSSPHITPTATTTGRRAALANWLTRPDHPLTARIVVNRIWQGHFGTGLVATPSDFGTLGGKPSHPQLLDWLAVEFVDNGWSLKHLHRLIVTSAVYRQASVIPLNDKTESLHAKKVDPDNRLLGRMPIRRLDAEQVRDALLAVSGELKQDAGGPGTPAEQPRRSIYSRIRRNTPAPLLAAFDTADGVSSCARRNVTVTPTQSLLLLNGRGTLTRAAAFAARVMPAHDNNASDGVDAAYRLAFGRSPTSEEMLEAQSFLRQQMAAASGKAATPTARKAAWTDFCHALLNANEFFYVD